MIPEWKGSIIRNNVRLAWLAYRAMERPVHHPRAEGTASMIKFGIISPVQPPVEVRDSECPASSLLAFILRSPSSGP